MAKLRARKLVGAAKRVARRGITVARRLRPSALGDYRTAVGAVGRENVTFAKGSWFGFEVDSEATRSLAPQINYRNVAGALTASDVAFAVVSTEPFRPYDVAIHRDEWARAVDALIVGLDGRPAYGSVRARGNWESPIPLSSTAFRKRALAATSVKIHVPTRRSKKSPLNGAALACSVRAWTPDATGRLLEAPGSNATATQIPADAFSTIVPGDGASGVPEPRFRGAPVTEDLSVQFPIDLVYLWVDGSDPEWLRVRGEVDRAAGKDAHERSTGEWLYRDRNELLYSLRSVDEYAPWVRKIHFFTANQVPKWLDVTHPKIQLHFHSDVFDAPDALPTYNSHAIGSRIHHIPGLSEHYLVMNDDVMFGAPVVPEDFFSAAGVARVRFSTRHAPIADVDGMTPIEGARSKTAGLIERLHGVRPSRLFAHAPIPQVKSSQFELEKIFSEDFAATQRSQFRSADDIVIVSWLGLYHLMYTGRAVASDIGYQYFYCTTPRVREALVDALQARAQHVICVNDGDDAGTVDGTDWLSDALKTGYPVRSAYELPAAQWRTTVYRAAPTGDGPS